jgi:hypothetical protein
MVYSCCMLYVVYSCIGRYALRVVYSCIGTGKRLNRFSRTNGDASSALSFPLSSPSSFLSSFSLSLSRSF